MMLWVKLDRVKEREMSYPGYGNVFIGYKAGIFCDGKEVKSTRVPKTRIWKCEYCGQCNNEEREGCRSCLAPRAVGEHELG